MRYDVIVVGAGPAGNLAAQRLASFGHSVCVVDWREKVGDKLCTGIVGRECMERYCPDLTNVYSQASSAVIVSPSGKRFTIAKAQPQAYIVNRIAFVASLAEKAQQAGATYLLGPRVTAVDITNEGVNVTLKTKQASRTIKGSVIIVASGFASPIVGMVGLADGIHSEVMRGVQAEVEAPGIAETEVYLGNSIAPGSFGWLVPLPNGRALMGLVTRQKLNGHMRYFMDNLKKSGRIKDVIRQPQTWGIPVKPLSKTYGPHTVVVGDAAGLAKPTTGGGIYYAMLSGDLAADTVHKSIVAQDFSAQQMKNYETGWKSLLEEELRVGYTARLLYEYLGDKRVESLVEKFTSMQVREDLITSGIFSFDRHSRIIRRAIGHKLLGGVFTSIGTGVLPLLSTMNRKAEI